MPCWVCIVCRVVGGIGVQVLCPRLYGSPLSPYPAAGTAPAWVVVARTQVIQPCIVPAAPVNFTSFWMLLTAFCFPHRLYQKRRTHCSLRDTVRRLHPFR